MKLNTQFCFLCALLILTCLSPHLLAFSNSITGKVHDKNDHSPLPGVNVYLSGTTYGCATDRDGNFLIKDVPPGNYIIVASIIGYQSERHELTVKLASHISINFELYIKALELKPIEVTAERPKEWFDDLDIFLEHFLGKTKYTSSCKIENELHINFRWSNDTLYASTSIPLIVYNYDLGYKVECDLKAFYFDDKSKNSWTDYTSFYSELNTGSKETYKDWIENRTEAFGTSLPHFFIWLKNRGDDDTEFLYCTQQYWRSIIFKSKNYYGLIPVNFIKTDSLDNKYTITNDRFILIKDTKTNYYSVIKLLGKKITIDQYGYTLEKHSIIVYGYWGTNGLANQLPKYYTPPGTNN